jgi:hypothetical protein
MVQVQARVEGGDDNPAYPAGNSDGVHNMEVAMRWIIIVLSMTLPVFMLVRYHQRGGRAVFYVLILITMVAIIRPHIKRSLNRDTWR